MKNTLHIIARLLLISVVGCLFGYTNNIFLMVGGSDATSLLLAPKINIQVMTFLAAAICLMIPASGKARVALTTSMVVLLLLGSHRLLIDNLHHCVKDVYLALPIQSLALEANSEAGLEIQPKIWGFSIRQTDNRRLIRIWSPRFVGLDQRSLVASGL